MDRNRCKLCKETFVTYEENERLKEKIDSYDEIARSNENYKREIESLKEELELNETLTNYEKLLPMLLIVHQIHGKTCLLWIVARKMVSK